MTITLRDIRLYDLNDYLHRNHPDREFHRYNGPYYPKDTREELTNKVSYWKTRLQQGESDLLWKDHKLLIVDADQDVLIGEVNWYRKSQETYGMEIGIVIFNEQYRGQGIGSQALPLRINLLFEHYPELVRIGLSTWSGNHRMMKLAIKLGLYQEACYKKARIVDGQHYDALSYGILREEREQKSSLLSHNPLP